MEYNENPPYEKVGRYMDGLPSKVKQIDKDGNSLFRAISYMLVGHEEHYDEIRQKNLFVHRRSQGYEAVYGYR